MIAKHSAKESRGGEGVEVIVNEACHDPIHGDGQYTEKRIYLARWVIWNIYTLYTGLLYPAMTGCHPGCAQNNSCIGCLVRSSGTNALYDVC